MGERVKWPGPGREADALVAEHVMGEPRPAYTHGVQGLVAQTQRGVASPGGYWFELFDYEHGDIGHWVPLDFTASVAAAWEVVEKMRERGRYLLLDCDEEPGWYASFDDADHTLANAFEPAAPEAIAIAALRASGIDVDTERDG